MPDNEPDVIFSSVCQSFLVDGHRFEIKVFCTDQDPKWLLEVVDDDGTSHVWEAPFESDDEALAAALLAFEEEGADGFLNPNSNVISFPVRRS